MSQQANLTRRTQEINLLARTAELLSSIDLDEVLGKTLSLLTNTVNAERGSFFLFNPVDQTAERFITRRDLPPERSQTVVDQVLENGLAGWVYRNRKVAVVHDTLLDDRWVVFEDDLSPVRSVLCVPFLSEEQILGIMTLEHASPQHFTEHDLLVARAVANQASVAIKNAQLFYQVETHERQLQAVLDSTVDPILTVNHQLEIKLVNPAALSLLQMPHAQVSGQPLSAVGHSDFFQTVAARLTAGEINFELHDERTKREFTVQISSWREGTSNELGHVIVFNDITALKDLSRIKSQMLQMASHDLKNPLGVIQGYAEIMLMELQPGDDYHDFAQDISNVSQRMLDMVTQLLDVERIEASAAGTSERFVPNEILREIIASEKPKADQKKQVLLEEIDADLPEIEGDRAQLREAFANLLENAIKYTPDNGFVIIRASVDDANQRLEYAVEDTGYGIPVELQDRIFERFYRAKQPGAEHIPGTGLGLSLVKAVVKRHGGDVWFTSQVGKGSTFGFWLPLTAAH
jgi:PAS domain S-box-containing protein